MKLGSRLLMVLLAAHGAVWACSAVAWLLSDGPPRAYAVLLAAHGLLVALLCLGYALWTRSLRRPARARAEDRCGELVLSRPDQPELGNLENDWRMLQDRMDDWVCRTEQRDRALERLASTIRAEARVEVETEMPSALELRLDGPGSASDEAASPEPGDDPRAPSIELDPSSAMVARPAMQLMAGSIIVHRECESGETAAQGAEAVVVFSARGRVSSRARVLLRKLGNRVRDTAVMRGIEVGLRRKDQGSS